LDEHLVATVLREYWPLEHWQQLPLSGTWADQPAWWGDAMREIKGTFAELEHEEMDALKRKGGN
jgi:hypothetical protein